MTSPIYTAVQTVGPSDPNAGIRAKLYGGLSLVTAVVSLLQTFHIFTPEQGNSIGQIVAGLLGLLGAGGLALAGAKTAAQNKNGTFDPPPPPPPAITAVEGMAAIANQFQDLTATVTDGLQHVQDVAGGFTGALGSIIPGSLVEQLLGGRNAPPGAPRA